MGERILLREHLPPLLAQLVDLGGQELSCLLLGVFLEVRVDLGDQHICLNDSLLRGLKQTGVSLPLLLQLVLELDHCLGVLLILIQQIGPLLIAHLLPLGEFFIG